MNTDRKKQSKKTLRTVKQAQYFAQDRTQWFEELKNQIRRDKLFCVTVNFCDKQNENEILAKIERVFVLSLLISFFGAVVGKFHFFVRDFDAVQFREINLDFFKAFSFRFWSDLEAVKEGH